MHAILEFDLKEPRVALPPRLTDRSHACPVTGFLPLHCAVANGQVEMYDFLSGANHHIAPVEGELRVAVSAALPAHTTT